MNHAIIQNNIEKIIQKLVSGDNGVTGIKKYLCCKQNKKSDKLPSVRVRVCKDGRDQRDNKYLQMTATSTVMSTESSSTVKTNHHIINSIIY